MKRTYNIESGTKFNFLTVIKKTNKRYGNKGKNSFLYKCVCCCGKETHATSYQLKSGRKKSCGCYNKKISKERFKKIITKHGLYNTRVRRIWQDMKTRCTNKNRKTYNDYGGRGIKVCEEWSNDFMKFYNWSIENGYSDSLSIDRINNDGDYEPENCRWTNKINQANNIRSNKYLTLNGETDSLANLCRKYNKNYNLVKSRINKLKWDTEKAFFEPERKEKNLYFYNGSYYSIGELSKKYNIKRHTLWQRINKYGWSIKKSIEER